MKIVVKLINFFATIVASFVCHLSVLAETPKSDRSAIDPKVQDEFIKRKFTCGGFERNLLEPQTGNFPRIEFNRQPIEKFLPAFSLSQGDISSRTALTLPDVAEPFGLEFTGLELIVRASREISKLQNLTHLKLNSDCNALIPLPVIRSLNGMKNLTHLSLNQFVIEEDQLKELKDLPSLQILDLSQAKVDANSMKCLRNYKKLETLVLISPSDEQIHALREAGLFHLLWQARTASGGRPKSDDEIVSLEFANIRYLTNNCVEDIVSLKNLKRADLSFLTGNALKKILREKTLEQVVFNNHELDDEAFKIVALAQRVHTLSQAYAANGMKAKSDEEIYRLAMNSSHISDDRLPYLSGLKNLAVLEIADSLQNEGDPKKPSLTPEGLRSLCTRNQLIRIDCDRNIINDDVFQTFFDAKKLHLLPVAQGPSAESRRYEKDEDITSLEIGGSAIGDDCVERIISMQKLTRVGIAESKFTFQGLSKLAKIKNLTEIHCRKSMVNDMVLRSFVQTGKLHVFEWVKYGGHVLVQSDDEIKSLSFRDTSVSGAGFQYLAALKNLVSIEVGDRELRLETLKRLSEIKTLRHLDFPETAYTDHWLNLMVSARMLHTTRFALGETGIATSEGSIRRVIVPKCDISEKGIQSLVELETLTDLELQDKTLTAGTLIELAKLPALKSFTLTRVVMNVGAMNELAAIKSLTALKLYETNFREEPLKIIAEFPKLEKLTLVPAPCVASFMSVEKDGTYTITGTGFTGATNVVLGATPATKFTVQTDTTLTATFPKLPVDTPVIVSAIRVEHAMITNEVVKILSRNGKLHILPWAFGEKGPVNADEEVGSFDLSMSASRHTEASPAGVSVEQLIKVMKSLKSLRKLNLSGQSISATLLSEIEAITQLTEINFEGCRDLKDSDLKIIKTLPQLKVLNVTNSQVSSEGLLGVTSMKRLENLVVEVGKVSNELVAAMARKNKIHVLPIAAKDNKDRPVNDEEVTSLWLSGSSLTVHCLKDFVGLKNLSAIHARGLGGGKQWIDLARLPSVKTLDVDFSPTAGLFTAFVKEGVLHKLPNAGNEVGSGLKAVASDEQIRWLVLPIDGPITKEVMTSITSLKKLESLSLRGTQTTDEGLKILTALTELKALDLSQTQVTNACFKEVSKFKHLTDLKVDHLDLNDSALAAAEYSRLHLLPGLFREDGKTRAKSDDEIVVCVWPAADGTNQSLKALAGCSHLTELQIQGEGLTDEGVDNIAALKHLVKLTLMQTALTDAGLTHLTKSKNLRVLELHDGVFTEAGLEKLDKFDNLTTLKLDGLPVSANCLQKWNLKNVTDLTILGTEMNDSVLNEIARWEQLKSLTISGNAATPEGVKKLTALSNLKTLRIYNLNDPETCFELRAKWSQLELLDGVLPPSYLTDDGITKLVNDGTLRLLPFATRLDGTRPQSLEAIEVIKLENVNITAQGVKALVKLKNLTRVCLDGVPIGDEGVSELSKLKKLSTLRVPRTRITNASMDGLVGMRELTKLDISNNVGITGKRIHKLSALTNLKYLVLNEIPVGPELMELRKSLPNCKVVFNNPLTGNPWTE